MAEIVRYTNDDELDAELARFGSIATPHGNFDRCSSCRRLKPIDTVCGDCHPDHPSASAGPQY